MFDRLKNLLILMRDSNEQNKKSDNLESDAVMNLADRLHTWICVMNEPESVNELNREWWTNMLANAACISLLAASLHALIPFRMPLQIVAGCLFIFVGIARLWVNKYASLFWWMPGTLTLFHLILPATWLSHQYEWAIGILIVMGGIQYWSKHAQASKQARDPNLTVLLALVITYLPN